MTYGTAPRLFGAIIVPNINNRFIVICRGMKAMTMYSRAVITDVATSPAPIAAPVSQPMLPSSQREIVDPAD